MDKELLTQAAVETASARLRLNELKAFLQTSEARELRALDEGIEALDQFLHGLGIQQQGETTKKVGAAPDRTAALSRLSVDLVLV